MKDIFTITPENLELFYSAVDFKSFLETAIMPPYGYNIEEYQAVFNDLIEKEHLKTDYFKMYDRLSKAIENFLNKGTFSKENTRFIKRELADIDQGYVESFKHTLHLIALKTIDELNARKAKPAAQVAQKNPSFFQRILQQPCGAALLFAAVFLTYMKVF